MRAGHNGGRVVKLRGDGTELWQQEDGDVGKVVVLEVVVGVAADQVIPVCCFFLGGGCMHVRVCARPRLHYRLLTLCPAASSGPQGQ